MLKTTFKPQYKHEAAIIDCYDYFLANHDTQSPEALGWKNTDSQEKRFEAIYKVIAKTPNASILDVGCGLGDFLAYLQKNNYSFSKYWGIDINPNMVTFARQKHDCKVFERGNVFHIHEKYDFVIGSGLFTVATSTIEIFKTIKQAYDLANVAIMFNFLSDNIEKPDNSGWFLNTFNYKDLLHEFTNHFDRIEINRDYLPDEDFLIIIRK